MDPIRFKKDMKVTIQALGWKNNGAYLPLEDDIASVAYWYQTEPHAKFPPLPGKADLAIEPLKPATRERSGKMMCTGSPRRRCSPGAVVSHGRNWDTV